VHVGFGARDGAAGVRMLDDASRSTEERPVTGNASTPSAVVYARVERYSRRVSWDRSRRGREDVAPVGGARGAPGSVGKRTLTMDLPVAPSKGAPDHGADLCERACVHGSRLAGSARCAAPSDLHPRTRSLLSALRSRVLRSMMAPTAADPEVPRVHESSN
jgi:hypothetical protein